MVGKLYTFKAALQNREIAEWFSYKSRCATCQKYHPTTENETNDPNRGSAGAGGEKLMSRSGIAQLGDPATWSKHKLLEGMGCALAKPHSGSVGSGYITPPTGFQNFVSHAAGSGGSGLITPSRAFQPFISHEEDEDENENEEEVVDKEIEIEEPPAVQLRKQPDRQVKGKERLCGTEGMCGKKKKKGKGPRLG
ncbi:hypothetical protein POM88_029413 [Heracleum sosnowskyi]|uniref:Uncharacterized protein n=1 Tax=Heracleum sosnowskyi TaxID=360622 RepID=A0AAD8HTV7_9APIA|nr:hypothetical protein POM88_029413 [Heracleum sosnowskyi]